MKAFTEVFPDLSVRDDLAAVLSAITVERVLCSSAKHILFVHATSRHLLTYGEIRELENALTEQILSGLSMNAKLSVRFLLSERYTPELFYEQYKKSLIDELSERSPLTAELLSDASPDFSDGEIVWHLPAGLIAEEMGERLTDYLERVFRERAGFGVTMTSVADESLTVSGDDRSVDAHVEELMRIRRARKEKAESEGKKVRLPSHNARTSSRKGFVRPDPDMIYGKSFEGEPVRMDMITSEPGEVTVRGDIFAVDERETKTGKVIFTFSITDYTDSIRMKLFAEKEEADLFRKTLRIGKTLVVHGIAAYDEFDREFMIRSVTGIREADPIRTIREDRSPDKRIELHCHTKMSEMDAVTDVKDLLVQAYRWGHKAMAVTDHGIVQAFPDALHTIGGKGGIPADADFKIIYGMEGYLVDDSRRVVEGASEEKIGEIPVVVFSLLTTGHSPYKHHIVEIAAHRIEPGGAVRSFHTLADPGVPLAFAFEQISGLSDRDLSGMPSVTDAVKSFAAFCEGACLAAFDIGAEMGFLERSAEEAGVSFPALRLDMMLALRLFYDIPPRAKFERYARTLHVKCEGNIRAGHRADAMKDAYGVLVHDLRDKEIDSFRQLAEEGSSSYEHILSSPYFHVCILTRSEEGRRNLYSLVSESHLRYFRNRPRIPKSLLAKKREGLLIGSACSAGEVYQAILRNAPDAELARLISFYDYLEIMPQSNNAYLLGDARYGITTAEEIRDINRRIVSYGEEFGKPVVATGDVHFLDPEDEIYRRIILSSHGMDEEQTAPLYFRTTDEMLSEFSYLGEEKAREVVIEAPAMIAGMCGNVSPIYPEKCPPSIPNSSEILKESCLTKAHTMYGDPLPPIVEQRLTRELDSIIGNGYSVMYIIARKLVAKSEEDGYIVGSRGSVGSSFAATMSDITEVNPLPPHYYCTSCHYVDFDSEEVKKYTGEAGCDMPDRLCPVCGKPLRKDGFDIPFETFLGFKGDKEPDIDLNFSGEEQNVAQAYTEEIFGKGQTFKAGTIGTVADRTAIGYVKGYFEKRGEVRRNCEIMRLSHGCEGVKATTGQHPGGVIVVPRGMDINTFTPVQYPANKPGSVITTHFDYHSIDKNLLKLDILGHDDPSMIRMLQDLTGVDPRTVPLNDPKVISLFSSTEALGISPEDIGGVQLGVLGIPEFGTNFVIGMLLDTKPSTVAELIRISGLSHGTNVWLDNAQKLIRDGDATLSTAICTRDDIMLYLIGRGVEPEHSFKIMESVRKGKGLTPQMEEEMRACSVPDWYIWSCKQIKYMFPKAHAAAYVMNALRIAYYKVYYPAAYYAAYFSIRSKGFSYEKMCLGPERLGAHIRELEEKSKNMRTATEDDLLRDMYIAREMYARGISFLPIDLYESSAKHFKIVDGKILPAFTAIDGLGETAAVGLYNAAKEGSFLSKDDFRNRSHVSKTIADLMEDLGILGQIPESNQMSIFDR